jgi:hypothetical protein
MMSFWKRIFGRPSEWDELVDETRQFVLASTVSESETQVAAQLGIAPSRLADERRLLLAGAVRSILIEFEHRGTVAAAQEFRKSLDAGLQAHYRELPALGDETPLAELESALVRYGMAERPKVALAFFCAVRGASGSDEDMRAFPDFLALFDSYASDIETFLKPRIGQLAHARP